MESKETVRQRSSLTRTLWAIALVALFATLALKAHVEERLPAEPDRPFAC